MDHPAAVSTAERLRALGGRLSEDLARPGPERDSGAEDSDLAGARRAVLQAADRLDADDRAGAQRRLDEAAHLVVDSWPSGSELGREVLQNAQAMRRA